MGDGQWAPRGERLKSAVREWTLSLRVILRKLSSSEEQTPSHPVPSNTFRITNVALWTIDRLPTTR